MNARSWLLVVLGCCACSHAHGGVSDAGNVVDAGNASDAGAPFVDRRYQLHQRLNEGCAPSDYPPDDPPPASDQGPLTMVEDRTAWLAASEFEIELQHTRCYGFCPPYSVHIDHTGQVAIRATDYAPHPGVYADTIAPERARELFELMIDHGFLDLRRRYLDELAGCAGVHTDDYSSQFSLSAAGRTKEVEMYWGCEGSPANDVLSDLDQRIQEASNVNALVQPAMLQRVSTFEFAASYVLHGADSDGLLRMTLGRCYAPSIWSVEDCDGRALAHGQVWGQGPALLLADAPFTWPAAGADRNVAVLTPVHRSADYYVEPSADLTVSVRTLNEELVQTATPGDSCSL